MSAAPSPRSAQRSPETATTAKRRSSAAAEVEHRIVADPLPADAYAPVTKYKRERWTEAELAILRERYPHEPTARIAADLGRSVGKVYAAAKRLGLTKTAEFMRSPESGILQKGQTRPEGVAHQFKPGIVPANKGKRMPGWAPGRMATTQFRKGQRSGLAAKNWRPIGTILADHEGFLHVKVREAVHGQEHTGTGNLKVWPLYHRYVYEQANGPIPPKHVLRFRDGNRQNCALENLELISMAENARRNQMFRSLPRELAEVIQLAGALKRKIRRRTEKENNDGKEQNERPE